MSVHVVFGAMVLFDVVLSDYVARPHVRSRSLVFLVENHEAYEFLGIRGYAC